MTLDRRLFVKAGGFALLTLGAGPSFLTRAALAASEPAAFTRRKTLVTIFLRGAMDGLAAVPLIGDPRLAELRPRLAMTAARGLAATAADERTIDLDGRFGLHPALSPLKRLFDDGRLAIVHASGSPDPTRSHFDAQDFMETGTPGRKGTSSGWLNRAVGLLGHDGTPLRAVSMTSAMPRSLYGDEPAVAVRNLADFKVDPAGGAQAAAKASRGFEALYRSASKELLSSTADDTFGAVRMLSEREIESYRPSAGAEYPSSPLGQALRQVAMLVKAGVGLEVAFAESGGWDTHVQQGSNLGTFARRATDLARSIEALWTDLGTFRDDVVVMTMTEFGRTVAENGSAGTDHGHGSCQFVLGNSIAGGKVLGELPSLDPDALFEGRDLPVTTDFRSIFAGVAGPHLGIADDDELFPGWRGSRLPIFR